MTGLHTIVMPVFAGCQILDVTGPLQMFAGANDELASPHYRILIAADARGPVATSGGIRIEADIAFTEVTPGLLNPQTTLMVPGGGDGQNAALKAGIITALVKRADTRGARLVSICSGAFFLAAAGVLDGMRAATHWRSTDLLKKFRPEVDVDSDAIYLQSGRIWTSAGVTAGIDLALAIIDGDLGPEVALAVARRHVVYRIRPGGQSQFSSELVSPQKRDGRIAKLLQKIARAPDYDWRTENLACEAGVSQRSLTRLFRREFNAGPAESVERIRLDLARNALLETDASVEVIAARCGFGSLRRMDRAFARLISASPTEFRSRFKSQRSTNP